MSRTSPRISHLPIVAGPQPCCSLVRVLAVVLVCATFPLIWVGGLVTTYHAGMAVPDWPTTYGYNLFLYPWPTWVLGPWDLFIEHGHRLFGAIVGLITIGLVLAAWRGERRRVLLPMALVALAAVIFQGVLGGLRVRLDARTLAQIHGCFGPLFFAFTCVLAAVTSPKWMMRSPEHSGDATKVRRLAVMTTLLAYLQLVLGSELRHGSGALANPDIFRAAVWFHLCGAALVAMHVFLLAYRTRGLQSREVRGLPRVLAALVAVQLVLGAGTWVVKYGWPAWMGGFLFAQRFTVADESYLQALLTTAHVATGSLILAVSSVCTLRAFAWLKPAARRNEHRVTARRALEAVA